MSSPEKPSSSTARERHDALPPASTSDALLGPKAELAKVIPRRPRVTWWLGIVLALGFAMLVLPSIAADRWFASVTVQRGEPAPVTVRVPPFAGYQTSAGVTRGGGVLIARGEVADRDTAVAAAEVETAMPHGASTYLAFFLLVGVLGALFTHHTRRSNMGRLIRVQLASLGLIVVLAIVVKATMLMTGLSVLVVPVALFAMVPTLVLDRVVGLATGTLAALVVSFLVPFDVGVAILLLVQAGAAGLVVAERPKKRLRAALVGGAAATLFMAATYPLMLYLTAGRLPLAELSDPLHSAWLAAALGPALATALAIALAPLYQLLVGEITHSKLVELEDLSHPLLRQIATRAPGTWQHSLTMANMAEIAANAIGANGRLVRVGAYFHDLGKSLQPKYFIENLEPGETSPHDKLPPEVSCDAIFAHVTEGIVSARKAGLHERIIDFMHMHHGNGVLEYFWARSRENGNPRGLTVEDFRYPGVPPQSRETAILSICDAVEAAARTLKKPEVGDIDKLVQRIVYGKLHLGQLDDSGLSMGDLRRVADSLRETIRHANHGRIEYPWQRAQQQDATTGPDQEKLTQTGPRLDSLDRPAKPDTVAAALPTRTSEDALAATDSAGATPNLRLPPRDSSELATRTTAPVLREGFPRGVTAPPIRPNISAELEAQLGGPLPTDHDETRPAPKQDIDPEELGETSAKTRRAPRQDPENDYEEAVLELRDSKPKLDERAATSKDAHERATVPNLEHAASTQPAVPRLSDLAASRMIEGDARASEESARMARVTAPVGGERELSHEVMQFAADAKAALDNASKDLATARELASEAAPAARKRAATLPPIRPPTVPPPLGRRSSPSLPPLPPMFASRPPTNPPPTSPPPTAPPNVTAPPPDSLRPPARSTPSVSGTVPPPSTVRPPGPNLLDDMITLRPTYEKRPELDVTESDDGSVLIQPKTPDVPAATDDASTTQPRLETADDSSIGDVTSPDIRLPLEARESRQPKTSWGQSLADRIDRQIDDDFGTDTPASPPPDATRQQSIEEIERLHRQGLLGAPADATRQQSIEEIERLHRQGLLWVPVDATRQQSVEEIEGLLERPSEPELQFSRRPPFTTTEVDDADIESAIELAPPARRSAIGIAKKRPPE